METLIRRRFLWRLVWVFTVRLCPAKRTLGLGKGKERIVLLAVVFVVFCHFPKCVLVHIRIKDEVGSLKLV